MLDLDRLEALCERAGHSPQLYGMGPNYEAQVEWWYASRTALPELIAEVRRLRQVEQAYIKIVPFLAAHGLLDYTNDSPTLACGSCGAVQR